MNRFKYYLVNGITLYRLLASPFLIWLIFMDRIDLFKWFLGISFFTDLIDGYMARTFRVVSVMGARMDSLADDLTIIAAVTGMIVLKNEFFNVHFYPIVLLLVLFLIQNILAFSKYRKATSFHTYFAKAAAIFQGVFFITLFFLPEPILFLYYSAIIITGIELIEEIILVLYVKEWRANVKGLYWEITARKN
jgi:phosphatidylglycerophosphate synthase